MIDWIARAKAGLAQKTPDSAAKTDEIPFSSVLAARIAQGCEDLQQTVDFAFPVQDGARSTAAAVVERANAECRVHANAWSVFDEERRYCTQCRNLMPSGRCAAAARGELATTRTYEPIPDQLQRCAGYLPGSDDLDQRTGRERCWPA